MNIKCSRFRERKHKVNKMTEQQWQAILQEVCQVNDG
jgi:hypothetical protein